MASAQAAKKELRKQIKQILAVLPQDVVAQQTSRAVGALLALPEYQAARRISVYLSMPAGEISTATIVHDALAQGKKVFVPYTYQRSVQPELKPKSIMDMVELDSFRDFESFQPDKWGIPTPSAESITGRKNSFGGQGLSEGDANPVSGAESGLDLIVVPGMAFDADFGRLGHGKGFYDFFLDRSQQHSQKASGVRMPFLVGLALKEQLLPPAQSVPMDATDWRLDALVVGNGEVLRSTKAQPNASTP
ncbi:5-formyltetrahydrofolate cyclo-ligase [Lasiodiplodia theobromae]|uniref:5-formyltetrahydrofolate cyclo-ligase n=1 Tax=Lasiodiplodia theobromae TaxID=45133 RepID=A0A5N5DIJ1_9PEZI|nr:putative 5-formyltetrahydrofolate cyclo-ligase [Lasiodiplodia theobromae]KAF9636931.1 5-formyltetrahydrofolate cyclo-ligase [Lasiodiplodia theobromae]